MISKAKSNAINKFNTAVRIGDSIQYTNDFGEVVEDTVKHEATIMGGHTPVMWLKKAGSYLLERWIQPRRKN